MKKSTLDFMQSSLDIKYPLSPTFMMNSDKRIAEVNFCPTESSFKTKSPSPKISFNKLVNQFFQWVLTICSLCLCLQVTKFLSYQVQGLNFLKSKNNFLKKISYYFRNKLRGKDDELPKEFRLIP